MLTPALKKKGGKISRLIKYSIVLAQLRIRNQYELLCYTCLWETRGRQLSVSNWFSSASRSLNIRVSCALDSDISGVGSRN